MKKDGSNRHIRLLTGAELTEIWPPFPAFVGPSMPPMIAWQRRGEPKDAWQIAAEARATAREQVIAGDLFAWAGA